MSTNPELERRVRDALHREAHRIAPNDLRAQILSAAHAAPAHVPWWKRFVPSNRGWRVWAPLATGAVASVGVVVLVMSQSVPTHSPQVGRSATPSQEFPTPGADHSGRPVIENGAVTLPMYYVGVDYRLPTGWTGDPPEGAYTTDRDVLKHTTKTWALYREVATVKVDDNASPEDIVTAALRHRYTQPVKNHGYETDPVPLNVRKVSIAKDRITIDSSGESTALTDEKLIAAHLQALVWTTQAAAGLGNIPVAMIDSTHGTTQPEGVMGRTQNAQEDLLASVMIAPTTLDHAPDQPPLVQGWGCTILGNTRWRIVQGPKQVATGSTPVAPCPDRGNWRFQLPRLAPGTYTLVLDYGDGTPQPIPPLNRTFTVKPGG